MTELDEIEARVLGSLVEKSLTTPELYPLTLNALVNACNQKSSREPVMTLDHQTVEAAANRVIAKGFAARRHEAGERAPKFAHRVDALLGSEDPKVIGALCVLLLRGPQTIGEIKTRTERLCSFSGVAEVESLLQELTTRPGGPIVSKLPRQAGQKEARWKELFTTSTGAAPAEFTPLSAPAAPAAAAPPASTDRLAELEKRVAALEAAVERLSARP